eukprot:CAMPEP_0202978164 /NCGR_PEP_ID=MMETSP1396-20130829/84677_1 /ASSEMBLY_ACC=CAM_ASM_000872 /TAXON_ID= /ORGANISM="Pseudokeronopsis sp., Strain Brazil" /LENGTH=114 /DNA_ID=CAMNT_0049717041 /DNA_START=14 /DNA_END=358 /DNA_ORIENTATION=+
MSSAPEDIYAMLAFRFGKHYEPVLLEGLRQFFLVKERDEGAYFLEVLQHSNEEVQAVASKGVPRAAIFPTFALSVRNNKVFISPDGNKYSIERLPDYKTFSEIIEERFTGYTFD